MTVEQLIEKLSQLPKETKVCYKDIDGDCVELNDIFYREDDYYYTYDTLKKLKSKILII